MNQVLKLENLLFGFFLTYKLTLDLLLMLNQKLSVLTLFQVIFHLADVISYLYDVSFYRFTGRDTWTIRILFCQFPVLSFGKLHFGLRSVHVRANEPVASFLHLPESTYIWKGATIYLPLILSLLNVLFIIGDFIILLAQISLCELINNNAIIL